MGRITGIRYGIVAAGGSQICWIHLRRHGLVQAQASYSLSSLTVPGGKINKWMVYMFNFRFFFFLLKDYFCPYFFFFSWVPFNWSENRRNGKWKKENRRENYVFSCWVQKIKHKRRKMMKKKIHWAHKLFSSQFGRKTGKKIGKGGA